MSLIRMVLREILYRPGTFLLGVASTGAIVALGISLVAMLSVYEKAADQELDERAKATEAEMAKAEDNARKDMLQLGFNLFIFSRDQDLGELKTQGFISKPMPEAYVDKLANSGIDVIRHLSPSIERMSTWPEQGDRSIILAGTRGEVPLAHRAPKVPLRQPVPLGEAVLGYDIWTSLNLEAGQEIALQGRNFEIKECLPEAGNRDDMIIRVHLDTAQEILDAEEEVDVIQALKCHCAGGEVKNIRRMVADLLPDTQVLALMEKVDTRAQARDNTHATAVTMLEGEEIHRDAMMQKLAAFTAWFLPLLLVGGAVWIAVLALINAHQRTNEIGVLRAIGFRTEQVFTMLIIRASIVGVAGALFGYFLGVWGASYWCEPEQIEWLLAAAANPPVIAATLLGVPAIAIAASFPPALLAANRDPAEILCKEA